MHHREKHDGQMKLRDTGNSGRNTNVQGNEFCKQTIFKTHTVVFKGTNWTSSFFLISNKKCYW